MKIKKEIEVTEWNNGGLEIVSENGDKVVELITTLSKREFEKKFPETSTYSLLDCIYLENGGILPESQWNGEKYRSINGGDYRPIYKKVDEDEYDIIGYVKE